MSLDDFLPSGEARVLWSRFESLVGQQVFRLRVEGEAANIPSSLCSLLSCSLSSPENISQLEPTYIQSGQLQRNSNALEIDKQPLYGLPHIAQSACPLLRLVLLTMKELRCFDKYMNSSDAPQRLRNIKRSLFDVHKKALHLESQLHQYINPTLVTTLNRRTAKATFESELMCKLIDKLRKDARQSASNPEKRKRVCELTMKLKSLLLRQKCEWQCVGRLKETIVMARDMKGVLKFICQLSCLLEHCSDASRRLTERPPPYEYSSSYDSTSKQEDSSEALYEDVKPTDNHYRPNPSQSSHSEVTISVSLDFLSDKEFCEKSYESDSCTDTRNSNDRQQHRSSRNYKDSRSDSDAITVCSRKGRKVEEECLRALKKSPRTKIKRSHSTSSASRSNTQSGRHSRKSSDGQGKPFHSPSSYNTVDMPERLPAQPKTSHSLGCRTSFPKKCLTNNKHLQNSANLAEKTLNELLEVLGDYVENRAENGRRYIPLESEHKSSSLEHSNKQTECVYSILCIDSPKLSPTSLEHQPEPLNQGALQVSTIPSIPSNLQNLESINKQITYTYKICDNNGTQTYISGHSMNGPNESRLSQKNVMESKLSKQKHDDATVSKESFIESGFMEDFFNGTEMTSPNSKKTRMSKLEDNILKTEGLDETTMSKQDLNDTRMSKQSLGGTRLSTNILDDTRMSKRDLDDTRMSERDLDDTRMSKQDLGETRMSKQDLGETRMSKRDLDDTRMSERDPEDARISERDPDATRMSERDPDDSRISERDPDATRMSERDPDDTRMSERDQDDNQMSKQDLDVTRNSKPDFDDTIMSIGDLVENTISLGDLYETRMSKRDLDETRMSRKGLNECRLSQQSFNEAKLGGQIDDEVRMSHQGFNNARLSYRDLKQVSVHENALRVPRIDPNSIRMSHNDSNFPELCKQYVYGRRIGIEDHYEQKLRDVVLNQAQNHQKQFCDLAHKQCLDEVKMGVKNLNQTRMSVMDYDDDIGNTNYIRKSTFCENNTDMDRSEIKKQLAVECANVVKNRISSFSPYCDNRPIKIRNDTCKLTSPPRAKREESDQIFSSFEKSRNSTLKSESSKKGAEITGHFKERLGKIKNTCVKEKFGKSKNTCVKSKGYYLSPNTCSDDHEHETDYDNIDDTSENKNHFHHKKSGHHSPKQLQIAKKPNVRSNRRASSLNSRKSESNKFYMQPRCNSSDSSGSREPLLFSSQGTDLSFDDCSEFSYSMAAVNKSKESKKQRQKEPCFTGNDSDLLDYTTTTTDSCACDNAITSARKISTKTSSNRQRLSTRSRSFDDTEGDIDQEVDLEEESDQLLHSKSDSDLCSLGSDSQSSDCSRKSESHIFGHHSSVRQSELHHKKHSLSQPSPRATESRYSRGSTYVPFDRASSINEYLPKIDRRDSRHGRLHAKKYKSSSRSSFYNPNDDRADGQEDYKNQSRSHPESCPFVRQYTDSEILSQADIFSNILTNRQSRVNFETDLAKVKSGHISSPISSRKLSFGSANKLPINESRRSVQKDGSVLREKSLLGVANAESQLQNGFSASSHRPRSVQRDLSAASMQSKLLTQSSNLEQPSLSNVRTISIHSPAPSVHGDPSSTRQHSYRSAHSPEIFEQGSTRASSAIPCPTTSVHGDPSSTLQQSRLSAQYTEIFEQGSTIASSAIPYPTTSVHGDPPSTRQHSYRSAHSPGIFEQGSTRASSAIPCPTTSVHGDPSSTRQHSYRSAHSPGIFEQGSTRASSAIPCPTTSVHGDPSSTRQHSYRSAHSPEIFEQGSTRASSAIPYPTTSVHRDPSSTLQQSRLSAQYPEIFEQASMQTPSSAIAHPTSSVHKDPSIALQHSRMSVQSPGIIEQASTKTVSPAVPYPTTSVHGDPSLALQQSHKSVQSPGILDQASIQEGSLSIPISLTSVHGDPSLVLQRSQPTTQTTSSANQYFTTSGQDDHLSTLQQSQRLTQSPEVFDQNSAKTFPHHSQSMKEDSSTFNRQSQQTPTQSFEMLMQDSELPILPVSPRDPSATSRQSPHTELQQKQSNATQTSVKSSQILTHPSNTEELFMGDEDSPLKTWQPKSHEDASYASGQSRSQVMSEMSRHSPFQSEASRQFGTSRHSQFPAVFINASEQPLNLAGTSKHSVLPSEYSLMSRHSPTKSRQSAATPKSFTPEEFDINSEIHSELSRSSNKLRPRTSSTPKHRVSLNTHENVYDGYEESEQGQTLYSLPSSSLSSLTFSDSHEFYMKWNWWTPVLILAVLLLFLYYLICYLASIGGCVGCRAPLPNVFFSLMNSAVHSVRLIHTVPAPV